MSDPTIEEEESLISQDDIDKLLDSSSIEEAEDLISSEDSDDLGELSQDDIDSLMNGPAQDDPAEPAPVETELETDDLGELSQDDIDNLMNSNPSMGAEDDIPSDDGLDDDEMELISQDDIDSLMNSSEPDEPDASEEPGELSQDDIDSLMNSNMPDTPEPEPEPEIEAETGELSQDDIDAMMNTGSSPEPDEDDAFEMISQDDINNLMNSSEADNPAGPEQTEPEASGESGDEPDEQSEPEPVFDPDETDVAGPEPAAGEVKAADSSEEDPGDVVIDDTEAASVEDCLITQETLDDLIKNFDDAPAEEPADGAGDPLSGLDLDSEEDLSIVPDPADDSLDDILQDDAKGEEVVNLDDTDDLLRTSADDLDGLDFDEDDDVSQDDIDALLMETDDDDDDDILISQDDIDTLLMAADQEDEDLLGDMMDMEDDGDLGDEFDEDFGDGEEEEPVVLEGDDDEPVAESEKKKVKKKSKTGFLKSRLVIACASGLLVLGIVVPVSYFFFFSSDPGSEAVTASPVAGIPAQTHREIIVDTVTIDLQEVRMDRKPGNLVLEDFVILAPLRSRELSYITADISIDYSDQRAYHEINDNLSFYRDLIYDSLRKSLAADEGNEVTEADMLEVVEMTLRKVLPVHYIERVSFKMFKAS